MGNMEMLILLLRGRVDTEAMDERGRAALELAAKRGQDALIARFLVHGAEVEGGLRGYLLLAAGKRSYLRLARLLVNTVRIWAAETSLPDIMGHTPLSWMAYTSCSDVAEALFQAGTTVDKADRDGRTSLW